MHFCNCLGINMVVNSLRKLTYDIAKAHLWHCKSSPMTLQKLTFR